MANSNYGHQSYFELTKHSFTQTFVFILLLISSIAVVFILFMPLLQEFFEKFLSGVVYNQGESVPYLMDSKKHLQTTDYFFSWAVDIYKDSPQESRYWFNPVLSLISTVFIIGTLSAISISSLLPISAGFMRQKIEREIANLLNSISVNFYGDSTLAEQAEIIKIIKHADLKQMHEFSEEWGIELEDLKILQRAIIWRESSFVYQLIHLNDGITMYMRFYFTVKYGNAVLGLVYIGAAVLIIIVGLRGLKFIPPTQPSVVLFALGLEFTLLVTYAFSLIYTKQDEDGEAVHSHGEYGDNMFLSSDFGSAREIEKLLRVFIKSDPKKSDKGHD